MTVAELPENEEQRLDALYNLNILDTPQEADFDNIVKLASLICQVPISLVSLIDRDRQWFKARVGLDVEQTPREIAFCSHAILDNELFIVEDALLDDRFCDNPLVTMEPDIRFYAGMPVVDENGYNLGTLCVIDRIPRNLKPDQRFALEVLSKQVSRLFQLRSSHRAMREILLKLDTSKTQLSQELKLNDNLFRIMAHDIRGPLGTIQQLLELFEDPEESIKQLHRHQEGLRQMVVHTTDLLENLLNWSASLRSNLQNKSALFDLHNAVEKKLEAFKIQADLKGVKLMNAVPKGTSCIFNENVILFLLQNFISNALKFTSSGSIQVSFQESQEDWSLIIADTGIGMDPDTQAKLFNWDRRTTTLGTSNEKGAGIGLLLCQEMLNANSGTLQLSSQSGKGSTFTLTFPKFKLNAQ